MWLETAARNESLTFLDHHLRVGNSLVGTSVDELRSLPGAPLIRDTVHEDVRSELPSFLEPLQEIAEIPSDNPRQVKRKECLLRVAKNRVKPFLSLAHIWCSSFYLDNAPTDEQYSEVVSVLRRPGVLARLIPRREWLAAALECAEHEENRFFHWEFEFPEVYFSQAGRATLVSMRQYNPPTTVVSELRALPPHRQRAVRYHQPLSSSNVTSGARISDLAVKNLPLRTSQPRRSSGAPT